MIWDDLETPLREAPLFFVERPDGRRDWPEQKRQAVLLDLLAYSPGVVAWPVPNAGKRNPAKARGERILGGVLDITVTAAGPLIAMIEMKGYDQRGQPGKLRPNQIQFGNRLVRIGIPCACFFSPHKAADWLREQGFPIASRLAA